VPVLIVPDARPDDDRRAAARVMQQCRTPNKLVSWKRGTCADGRTTERGGGMIDALIDFLGIPDCLTTGLAQLRGA